MANEERTWFERTRDNLSSAIRAKHENRHQSMAEVVRDLEQVVSRGVRAQSLLGQDVWTKDLLPFMNEREHVASVPPYKPGEDPSVRVDMEARRAYASGVAQAHENLKNELDNWLERGKEASAKLKVLREAETASHKKAQSVA